MTIRTSITHPLGIDSICCDAGLLGMTLCPGKKGSSNYGAPWDRALSLDIRAIVDWGATSLVSLMEDLEFSELGVADLGGVAEAAGLQWHHLPIKDVGIPDEKFERLWIYSGHVLRRKLRSGEKIVLHCRGGLGRTGTIAARLLIECGIAPEEAVKTVRKSREGAIETTEQERYVLARKPYDRDEAYVDRVLGCLLGGAVGDAFGYCVEFDRLSAIRERYGLDGIRQPEFKDGGKLVISDDTQLTLFTAEGLLRSVDQRSSIDRARILEDVRQATLDWYRTQNETYSGVGTSEALLKYEALWKRRAPGTTCLASCAQEATGTPEMPINDSKGCGGAMRVAPIGLCPWLCKEEVFELASRCAAQTHGHPSGYISAGFVAAVIRDLLDGTDLRESVTQVVDIAKQWRGADETIEAVEGALKLVTAGDRMDDRHGRISEIGQGWVGEEALGIGLYSAFVASDFIDAVRLASNHDGDSDSTAAIAAQIHGAWKGLGDIPHAWIRRLDVLEPLLETAGNINARVVRHQNKWDC